MVYTSTELGISITHLKPDFIVLHVQNLLFNTCYCRDLRTSLSIQCCSSFTCTCQPSKTQCHFNLQLQQGHQEACRSGYVLAQNCYSWTELSLVIQKSPFFVATGNFACAARHTHRQPTANSASNSMHCRAGKPAVRILPCRQTGPVLN